MKALFYKDWITNRAGFAVNGIILLLLGTVMFFKIRTGGSITYFLPWFAVVLVGTGQYSLNSDVIFRMSSHVLAMPFSRRQVILSKFAPTFFVTASVFPLSAIFGFYALPDLRYLAPAVLIPGFSVGTFYAFYSLVHFLCRGKRSVFFSLGLYFLLVAGSIFFSKPRDYSFVRTVIEGIASHPVLSGAVMLSVVAGLFFLSFRIVAHWYERQNV